MEITVYGYIIKNLQDRHKFIIRITPSSPARVSCPLVCAPRQKPQLSPVLSDPPASAAPEPPRCASAPSPAAPPAHGSAGRCAGVHERSESSDHQCSAFPLRKSTEQHYRKNDITVMHVMTAAAYYYFNMWKLI